MTPEEEAAFDLWYSDAVEPFYKSAAAHRLVYMGWRAAMEWRKKNDKT